MSTETDAQNALAASVSAAASATSAAESLAEAVASVSSVGSLVDAAIEANPVVDDLIAAVGTKSLTRTNLYPVPSFEAGLSTLTVIAGTLSNPTTDAYAGTKVLRVTATGTGGFTVNGPTETIPVTAGEPLAVSAYFRGRTNRTPYFRATWTGATATTSATVPAVIGEATWQRRAWLTTAPAGATAVKIDFLVSSSGVAGDWFEVDAVLVEKSDSTGAYFDGDTADTSTQEYGWTGAAHLSSATYHVWVPPAPEITDAGLAGSVQAPLTKAELDANYGRKADLDHVTKTYFTRTNLATTPSFEAGLSTWGTVACTLTNPTTDAYSGTKAMRVTSTVTSGFTVTGPATIAVTAGEQITFSFYSRGVSTRTPYFRATWTGATATTSPIGSLVNSETTWQRRSWTTTVPAGATAVRLDILVSSVGVVGDWYEVDGLLIEKSATLGDYFDGATTDTDLLDNSWTGTAHLSASSQAVTDIPELSASDADIAERVTEPLTRGVLDAAYSREEEALNAEAVLIQRFRRDKGIIGTGGKAVIALRFDHWLNGFGGTVLPLLVERGIPSGVCYYSRMLTTGDTHVDADSTNFTWSDVQDWCIEKGVEVWSHSRSHADTPGGFADSDPDAQWDALVDEIVGSKTELEAAMPRVKIQGWMMPGNSPRGGHTYPYVDFNSTSLAALYDTRAGRLMRRTYPVVETDALGYLRPLPSGPHHGAGHLTTDQFAYATLKAAIDQAIAIKGGIEFMTHAGTINTGGSFTTLADYTAFLDYIADRVEAGVLDVVTPSGLYVADPERATRPELIAGGDFEGFNPTTSPGLWVNIPASTTTGTGTRGAFVTIPSAGGMMRQNNAYIDKLGVPGETYIVEAWMRRNASGTAATGGFTLADNASWSIPVTKVLPSGTNWTRVVRAFTIPTDVTYLRLDVGRSSGGAVDVTNVRVYKV